MSRWYAPAAVAGPAGRGAARVLSDVGAIVVCGPAHFHHAAHASGRPWHHVAMRKLLVVIAILLILAGLAGPAVTGLLVEASVTGEDNPLEAGMPPWLEAVSHDYGRGWFGAESRLRLVVTDRQRAGMLASVLDPGQFGDEPAVVVVSRITHGPLVDLLTPAIAQVDSLLFTNDVEGRAVQLPLAARTTIGLTGNLRTDWRLAEGGTVTPRGAPPLKWDGASGSYEATAGGAAEAASLEVAHIEIGTGAAAQRFDGVELGYVITRSGRDASLSADFAFDIEAAAMAPVTRLAGSASVEGLPLEVMRAALPVIRDLASMGAANVVPVVERHEGIIRAALDDPLPMRWRQLAGTEFGDIVVEFDITLPDRETIGAAPGGQAVVAGIAAAATVAGRIEMPVALADSMRATDPKLYEQLTMLRGTGVLAPDPTGSLLVMAIDYSGGELKVNGAPLPVSPPAASP